MLDGKVVKDLAVGTVATFVVHSAVGQASASKPLLQKLKVHAARVCLFRPLSDHLSWVALAVALAARRGRSGHVPRLLEHLPEAELPFDVASPILEDKNGRLVDLPDTAAHCFCTVVLLVL